MRYTDNAQVVAAALRAVRQASGHVFIAEALVAVLDLHPPSALAHALHQQPVWDSGMRRQVVEAVAEERSSQRLSSNIPQASRVGFPFEGFIARADQQARASGRDEVREEDLALAFADYAQAFLSLGVQFEALVAATAAREGEDRPAPQRVRTAPADPR